MLQLTDILYFIGDGKYAVSVIVLAQCKYYIDQFARLMPSRCSSGADQPANSGRGSKLIDWLKRLCLHRQEFLSLVFTLQQLGPVLSTCRDVAQEQLAGDHPEYPAGKLRHRRESGRSTDEQIFKDTSHGDWKSGHLESCVTKLLHSARESYDKVALLLVKVPGVASEIGPSIAENVKSGFGLLPSISGPSTGNSSFLHK